MALSDLAKVAVRDMPIARQALLAVSVSTWVEPTFP